MGLGFVTVHGLVAVLGPIKVLRLASQLAKMCSGLLHLDFWKWWYPVGALDPKPFLFGSTL